MEWLEPATPREMKITAQVMTRDRSGFYPDASHQELAEYLRPTPSSPNDGIVLTKAREIVGARTAPLEKARAIYDWVVDNTFRRAETRGCGLGNVAFMLRSGDLGGKCADINSLYVALARAAGLPARDFFGIRVADSKVSKSLGKSGDITKAQHCRAEVFIEGKGWFPVDPADVRKVVLEEQVALDSDKVMALRERLFGNWEMNWVGFNYARDFTLAGMKDGPIGFLMYPYAETAQGVEYFLDPDAFAYTMISNEVAVVLREISIAGLRREVAGLTAALLAGALAPSAAAAELRSNRGRQVGDAAGSNRNGALNSGGATSGLRGSLPTWRLSAL